MTLASNESLRSTSPLPDGWSELEIVEDVVVADGVELHRAGVASTGPGGEEVTGSAADAARSPAPRSYFELLERAATLEALRDRRQVYELRTRDGTAVGTCTAETLFPESDAPDRWRYARSNGIAIHQDWENATVRAHWELSERDRLLRAWYGEIEPQRIDFDFGATALAQANSYEWRAYAFPEPQVDRFSRDIHVVGVFGFPKRPDAPLILGYGARPDASGAREAALGEAMQLLAFLWGESVTEHPPDLGPTPMFHLEWFQYPGHHDILLRWLDGAHLPFAQARGGSAPTADAKEIVFVDLTPAWLTGGYRVAKAFCAGAAPLAFGDAPFAAHLPERARAHPIA
jgi:hypothetical protein